MLLRVDRLATGDCTMRASRYAAAQASAVLPMSKRRIITALRDESVLCGYSRQRDREQFGIELGTM